MIQILQRFTALLLLATGFASMCGSVPPGYYYYVQNKKKSALKTALHDNCKPLKEFDYGGGAGFTWEGFYYTDRNADNSVIDMYSDSVRYFNGFSAVEGMHIEHSFPKSWWGGYNNGAYRDLFHLYPADGLTNSTKNDLPLGEVTGVPVLNNGKSKIGKNGFGDGYAGNCFEPADEYKGDFARSYFYISSLYEELAPLLNSPMTSTTSYPLWQPWALDLLLKWNAQDPVSDKERVRNEKIYQLQGNRNPFIDYPNLANYIWGADTTSVYPFPVDTGAFLLAPRAGNKVDLGVAMVGDVRTTKLHFQAVNTNSAVQLRLKNHSQDISMTRSVLTTDEIQAGFDLELTFTPAKGGMVNDTLLIGGGGLADTLSIPVSGLSATDFITLTPTSVTPVGGTLQWISDPQATDYRLSVYQGDGVAGDLLISGYVEGSSWNKAVELYNGTGKTIDLSEYTLGKQSNGAGAYGSLLHLAGTLASGKTCTIVHKQADAALMARATVVTDSLLQFNGNDAIVLMRGGVITDMVGQADAGPVLTWGAEVTLKRKKTVTHPRASFRSDEWESYNADDISAIGSHSLVLTASPVYLLQNVSTGLTSSYPIAGLKPENTYTYRVEAVRQGTGVEAVNTMQLHTSGLDAPVVMDASGVQNNQFTANWEQTLYASGYQIDAFELRGQEPVSETEGFAGVGTAGTPLPTGWSGTASGNYSSAASSGLAIPSVALKNNGEWLQTKTYASPVTKLSFMYRFASTATNSSFGLYALSNGGWLRVDSVVYVNTTKTSPVYLFPKSQGITAFRFLYHKSSGNLAIDDVAVNHGGQDTVYVRKNFGVDANSVVLDGLSPGTTYYYCSRAVLGDCVSPVSETMKVITSNITAVKQLVGVSEPEVIYANGKLNISGLQGDEVIQVYHVSGRCVNRCKASADHMSLQLTSGALYIVRISNGKYCSTIKVIAG